MHDLEDKKNIEFFFFEVTNVLAYKRAEQEKLKCYWLTVGGPQEAGHKTPEGTKYL